MEAFLGKLTNQAMNYALRSGIAITSTYALKQCSRLLKTVDNNGEFHELQTLQERLDSKIRIISPAIDMIELIAARGNSSLESAVTLTKALRWDIQSLGIHLARAATKEEAARLEKRDAKQRLQHEQELRFIIQDMKKLLTRIEDAVPLINLAITTSGASLSTALPSSVSPSRLLQASACLTEGDFKFSQNPEIPAQIGPTFILSVYMLFVGRTLLKGEEETTRNTNWKEAIHKARVKLIRVPRSPVDGDLTKSGPIVNSVEDNEETKFYDEIKANEFSYQLEVIEDLDDDRVHSFDDDERQPGPFDGVSLAGIREFIPIHQISKIFYADTGKILNIGGENEPNSPVLLLKRDINALPPRRMMESLERHDVWQDEAPGTEEENEKEEVDPDESQSQIDHQLFLESPSLEHEKGDVEAGLTDDRIWPLPLDLDPEWIAFELYTEAEEDSSEDDLGSSNDSAYVSARPSSSREHSTDVGLPSAFSRLDIETAPSSVSTPDHSHLQHLTLPTNDSAASSYLGPVRSLSLLEMLIRLTSLQQFQQQRHLTIHDELLSFFLHESSTTGAGSDSETRRRTRWEARQHLGFDPYDESPVKRHGEDYQYQAQSQHEGNTEYSRESATYDEYLPSNAQQVYENRWSRDRSFTPQRTPEQFQPRSRNKHSNSRHSSGEPSSPTSSSNYCRPTVEESSSPASPYIPSRRATRPLDRLKQDIRGGKKNSPLGKGVSMKTDSSLGTSPGTPTSGGRKKRAENA